LGVRSVKGLQCPLFKELLNVESNKKNQPKVNSGFIIQEEPYSKKRETTKYFKNLLPLLFLIAVSNT
jgi:hypothetical protein